MRSSAIVTPRYFAAEALSSSILFKIYLAFSGLTFLVMWRTWHLEGKKFYNRNPYGGRPLLKVMSMSVKINMQGFISLFLLHST